MQCAQASCLIVGALCACYVTADYRKRASVSFCEALLCPGQDFGGSSLAVCLHVHGQASKLPQWWESMLWSACKQVSLGL